MACNRPDSVRGRTEWLLGGGTREVDYLTNERKILPREDSKSHALFLSISTQSTKKRTSNYILTPPNRLIDVPYIFLGGFSKNNITNFTENKI